MNKEILLQLNNVSVHYGGVRALDDATIAIDEGEIVALMGPNGAGKSTALKAIFGLAKLDGGKILWHQSPISPIPYEMVNLGISFVQQGRRVFRHLTVKENLEIGGYTVKNKNEVKKRGQELMQMFPPLFSKRKAK